MRDTGKTREQLVVELAKMRQRIAELEALEARRKRVEEELRETHDYMEKLLNYANAPIIVWDPVLRIIRLNHAFERLTGYAANEVVGQELSMLFPQASRDESISRIMDTLKGEFWESVEIPILQKSGEVRMVLWNSANIYAEDGKTILTTIAQGQDITERKRAEEEVGHLNRVLHAIRKVNQVIIREKDRARLLEGICDTLVETRGYYHAWVALLDERGECVNTAESGLGKDFLPMAERLRRGELPDCAKRALTQSEVVVTEDPPSACGDCPLADKYASRAAITVRIEYGGKVYGLLNVSVPIAFTTPGEEQLLFQEVATDIAFALHDLELEEGRKQMEEALKESEEFRSELLNNSPNPILVINQDTSIRYVNPALEELTGFSSAELIGKKPPYPWWTKETLRKTAGDFEKALSKGTRRLEELFQKKNGERFQVEITSVPVQRDGKFQYLLASWVDITERKRLEEQAHEAETLKRVEQARTELLANVSHELRTPLASIKGFSTMLLDYDKKMKRDEKRRYLGVIDKSTDRLTELIDQLLDMSRLEAGLITLDKVPTSIRRLSREVIAEARVRSPQHILILYLPKKRLPVVNIDGKRIQQVLDNLISNAVKYSGVGTEVVLSVRQAGQELLLGVADQGIGIPADELPKVFDRMYRVEQRLIPGALGVGLGLPICKGLVEAHGGRIWVESKERKGTTCSFTLPLQTTSTGDSHDEKASG